MFHFYSKISLFLGDKKASKKRSIYDFRQQSYRLKPY